jgi:hypothetical protein
LGFDFILPARHFINPGEHLKMDDAASSIRQYVAALSRLLLDFDDGEMAGATVVASMLSQFDPFTKHFASP